MWRRLRFLVLGAPLACLVAWGVTRLEPARAADEPRRQSQNPDDNTQSRVDHGSKAWTMAVEPKPMSPNVKKGLHWLVEHQLPGGGWAEGEESVQMRANASQRDTANVADTCIAVLALIRSGSTPREGLYRDAIAKGVRYVRLEVDESDSQSIAVTRVQGTRVQQKLGPNIDTFLASMLLAEVKGHMPDEASETATDLALHKVLGKIERHQKQDGTFDGQGWAPILAQAMCGKGINRARQAGARVSDRALARAEKGAVVAFQASRPASGAGASTGRLVGMRGMMAGGMGGSAGVELYSRAASIGVLQDSVNTKALAAKVLRETVANSKDRNERDQAKEKLAQIADAEKVQNEARAAVVSRLGDRQFIAGFGSNGGEEFLSYMNIAEKSESSRGGDEWKPLGIPR